MMAKQLPQSPNDPSHFVDDQEFFKKRAAPQRAANYTGPQWTAGCRPSEMKKIGLLIRGGRLT